MKIDAIVIGSGAAGMMCALQAGQRGRSVVLLDHAKKLAEKIRISGGGDAISPTLTPSRIILFPKIRAFVARHWRVTRRTISSRCCKNTTLLSTKKPWGNCFAMMNPKR